VKIGLVSPYDYSFPGGVVNHIAHLANRFIQSGHKVKIIAPCLREGTSYFEEEVTAVGRPFPIPIYGSVARVPICPWLPTKVRHILRKEKFDIKHVHEPFAPMLSLRVVANSNSALVGTFHACSSEVSQLLGKPVPL
jgi:phosphatidylinositol alpha-mannosyltransferase